MLAEFIVFVVFLCLLYFYLTKVPEGFPPGEWGYPFIGHLPSMKVPMKNYINDFREKYGKTFTWRIGSQPIVFMCDYRTIKKTFGGSSVAERPTVLSLDLYSEFGKYGLSNGNGLPWANLRRFSIRHLRDLGLGKTDLEDTISIEAENIVNDFKKYVNKPVALPYSLNIAALNVIWKIVADRRYEVDDKKIQDFERLLTDIFNDAQSIPVFFFDFFPLFNKIVPHWLKKKGGLKGAYERAKSYREFLQNAIDIHKKHLDVDNPKDFIDEFLIEIENNKKGKGSEATSTFSEKELLYTLSDLFGAGSETVSSTVRWVLLLMAEYPEIQKKVQDEIDSIVARDRLPSLNDRSSLVYLDAVLNEAMRFKTVTPFSLYHCTSEETEIDGYKVPKDTMVVSCSEYSHFDPDYWEKPEEFKPERFISENGTFDSRKEGFLAFSIGRRVCPGESTSRIEIFLFVSALLHRFSFKSVETDSKKDLSLSSPMFYLPTESKVIILERNIE